MLVVKLKTILISLILGIIVTLGMIICCSNVYLQANTTPVTSKIIVLDAGHGAPEDGICLTYFLRM